MGPMYAVLLPSNLSIFSITALFTVLASINVMFDSGLLFVHMCYHIIAHYIHLISLRCNDEENHEFQTTVHKGCDIFVSSSILSVNFKFSLKLLMDLQDGQYQNDETKCIDI